MKIKKCVLSLVLVLCIAALLLPVTVSAGSLQVYTDIYDQIVYSGGTYDISVKVVGGVGFLQYRWQLCGYQKSGKDYWFYIAGKDWPQFFAPEDSLGEHLCMTTNWLDGEDKGSDWNVIKFRCYVYDENGNEGYSPEYYMHVYSTDALKARIDAENAFEFESCEPQSTYIKTPAGYAADFTMHLKEFTDWMHDSELYARQYFEIKEYGTSSYIDGVHFSYLRNAPTNAEIIAHADLYCGNTLIKELKKEYKVTVEKKEETQSSSSSDTSETDTGTDKYKPIYDLVKPGADFSVVKPIEITKPISIADIFEEIERPISGVVSFGDKDEEELPFEDVLKEDYFYDAVKWAYTSDPRITEGVDETHFGPKQIVTRAQAATFLWRAMGEPEPESTKNPFKDVNKDDYYYKAVLWAVENGITKGTDDNHFSPDDTCSTAHIITFIYRTLGIGDDGWYEEAAAWAKDNGLLENIEKKVSPYVACPRSDVVTFLYRAIIE